MIWIERHIWHSTGWDTAYVRMVLLKI